MKIFANKTKLASAVAIALTLSVGSAYAVNGNNKANGTTAKAQPQAKYTDRNQKITDERVVQEFDKGDLNIQFRYLKGKFYNVRFMNKGKEPMEVTIQNQNYVLGPGEYVVVVPPKLKQLMIHHGPVTDYTSTTGKNLPDRFKKTTTVNMPDYYHSKSISQSVTQPEDKP